MFCGFGGSLVFSKCQRRDFLTIFNLLTKLSLTFLYVLVKAFFVDFSWENSYTYRKYIEGFRTGSSMKRIRTSDLVPGMTTAEDVYSYNNQLVVPNNTVLTDKMITRLEFYSVLAVRVQDEVVARLFDSRIMIRSFGDRHMAAFFMSRWA